MVVYVPRLPSTSKSEPKTSWDGHKKIRKNNRPPTGSPYIPNTSVSVIVAGGTECAGASEGEGKAGTEDGMGGGHNSCLHIDHCPTSGKKWPPQNETDLDVLVRIENNEITGDDEFI